MAPEIPPSKVRGPSGSTAALAAAQLEDLRQRAEAALRREAGTGAGDGAGASLEELRIYQAELELQNDELRRAQYELEASRARYFELFDLAPVGYFRLDRTGMIVQVNLTGSLMLQIERRTLTRRHFSRFVADSDQAMLHRHIKRVFDSGERQSCEIRVRRSDGQLFDAHVESVAPPTSGDGARQCLCAVVDVSELRRAERQLELLMAELKSANSQLTEMAHVDPLTGILNRRGLDRVLTAEVSRARRSGAEPLALLADCDDFKRINDTLGHAVGDTVLREVAARLKGALRPSDQIARVGGDEFLVLLPDTSQAAGLRVAERMRLAVSSAPVMHDPNPVRVTMSVGAVRIPVDAVSIEEILSKAHAPLKRSKQQGKDSISTDELPAVTAGDLAARAFAGFLDFEGAVENDQTLGLYAIQQPIRAVADGAIIGVELLSRSQLSGFEQPADLFRLAMQRGVLTTLDLACLKKCLARAAALPAPLMCHVNVFPSTILNTPAERLLELFSDVDPRRICVEISEQQLIGDPAALQDPIARLTAVGLQLAMDDLGFGRTSLETLILLEPQIVKIDRRLVTGGARDAGRRRSLARLMRMLRSLEVLVVAEGVETEDDLELLADLGIAAGQGFYLGRPARDTEVSQDSAAL